MKFAPRLGERSLAHAKQSTEGTPWGEIWGVGTGSYNHQLFFNEPLVTRRHERFALSHGVKNDIDIPRVGKLLSPYGSLWLSSAALMEEHHTERLTADTMGRENLAELGLTPVNFHGRKSPYTIFVRPETPAVL